MADYESVPLTDDELELQISTPSETVLISSRINSSVGNDNPIPLTRPPPKNRDKMYIFLFILHIVCVSFFCLLERDKIANSFLMKNKLGNWTSMIMISTILGSFFGSLIIFLISNSETRTILLSQSIPISIVLLIGLANILLWQNQLIPGVAFLISSVLVICRYKDTVVSVNFTDAVISFVIQICQNYGSWLTLTCVFAVFIHTCTVLGWGVYLVYLLATISAKYSTLILVTMLFSLYWITKLFHAFVVHVVGGCVVWYFIRDNQEIFLPRKRLMLHIRCACTTSLGSLLCGSLLCDLSEIILTIHTWSINNLGLVVAGENVIQRQQFCCKRIVVVLISPFLNFAYSYNRLAFVLTAVYGVTFRKASELQVKRFPQSIEFFLNNASNFNLTLIAVEIASIISLFFGILTIANVNNRDNDTEGAFLTIVYLVAYCSISLCVEVYRAAIDALIVVYSIKPDKLASENQIIFLRFLRTSDPSLR